jgi:hypothetical protein
MNIHPASSPVSTRLVWGILGTACAVALAAPSARAQTSSYSNYLRQTEAIERNATASTNAALRSISQSIARGRQSADANLLSYVRQNYPRLMQQYRASGAYRSESFKQFANQELLSHATIKPDTSAFDRGQAAHQAQVNRFNSMQTLAKAQSDVGEARIHNMQANSDKTLAAVDNWGQGAIRGNSSFVNPNTGNAQWMPTYAPGAYQGSDGMNYHQDQNGRYSVQQGSSWVSMQPSR